MKHFVLSIFILATCSSCVFYQYNHISSNIGGITQEPLTFENDTLKLRYIFNHGLEEIEITNKSSKALYVDWSRSSLIINGESHPYWRDEATVKTQSTSYNSYLAAQRTNTTGIISNAQERISFMPPNSLVRKTPFDLTKKLSVGKKDKVGERYKYTEDSSPFKFRSYLTLSFDQAFTSPISLDHTFWISETLRTEFPAAVKPQSDLFTLPR